MKPTNTVGMLKIYVKLNKICPNNIFLYNKNYSFFQVLALPAFLENLISYDLWFVAV